MKVSFRLAAIVLIVLAFFQLGAAPIRSTPQNGGFEQCRLLPGGNVSLVPSPAATIASCGMPCFSFDPGFANTAIMPNGNNLVTYTWSSPPTSITTWLQSSCDGSLRQDNHSYTQNFGATGVNLPMIGMIDFPSDPLAPWNSYCGAGCAVSMTAIAVGGTNVQAVRSAAGDTAVQLIAMPHTTQTQ